MLEKVIAIVRRHEELNGLLADPEVIADPERLRDLAQEQADIGEIVEVYHRYQATVHEMGGTEEMLAGPLDEEMAELAREELETLRARRDELYEQMRKLLLPTDPRDQRNVIVEIRAGAGGEEAALWAADLFRMYSHYAEAHNWRVQVLSSSPTGIGGFKEIIFQVTGRGAYSRLKYESGVHRVQRVPATEAAGRIHTSTATVAVLPEAQEVEVEVRPEDLHIDVYRSSGHGGQSVNTTDSAVRITHIPTGIIVACQDERSQLQNKARAMSILRARLFDMEQRRQWEELDEARRSQVGGGERSEKIRTYNYPQNRATDHRIGLTSYRLQDVLAGGLDEFIDELATSEQAEKLRALSEG
ncbi:MAG TPA: peptide chain release factor 1 [Anaerolineae bacterium]|nr:peptide chain release factor 1 [Anaerolineae bacterium]HPL30159.1 peptide chain release factor 1 [Anaerolineae bacterium]